MIFTLNSDWKSLIQAYGPGLQWASTKAANSFAIFSGGINESKVAIEIYGPGVKEIGKSDELKFLSKQDAAKIKVKILDEKAGILQVDYSVLSEGKKLRNEKNNSNL